MTEDVKYDLYETNAWWSTTLFDDIDPLQIKAIISNLIATILVWFGASVLFPNIDPLIVFVFGAMALNINFMSLIRSAVGVHSNVSSWWNLYTYCNSDGIWLVKRPDGTYAGARNKKVAVELCYRFNRSYYLKRLVSNRRNKNG